MNPLTPFLMLVLAFSAFLIGWLIVYEIKEAKKKSKHKLRFK